MTPSETAARYIDKGWTPLPIPPLSKAPVIPNWPAHRATPAEFAPNSNVGVILGDPSAGLVDVDLDCPEAVKAAPDYLPPTATFGRASNPRSHWLYTLTPPGGIRRYQDPITGDTLLELRGNGGQTVFPGSVHESGEPINWDGHQTPAACPDLADRADRLAAHVLGERYGHDMPPEVEARIRQLLHEPPPPPLKPFRRPTDVTARASAYLARMPGSTAGQNGHGAAWRAALAMVRGFDLEPGEALSLLRAEFNPRCSPPWSERELSHKIDNATRSRCETGYLLAERTRPSADPYADLHATPDDPTATVLETITADPGQAFDNAILTQAAALRRSSPGDYERLVITLKQKHGDTIRVHRWEQCVGQLVKQSTPAGPQRWHDTLLRTNDGGVRAALANAVTALTEDTRWQSVLAWNEHTHQVEWHAEPPWPPEDAASSKGIWTEHEDALLVVLLERELGMSVKPSQARSAVTTVARRNPYHPIRRYLDGLSWDGTPRVDTWLATYLGASTQPTDYLQEVGSWVLIGGVVRAMSPGEKVDNVMVLEGHQGARKSSAVRVLGSPFYVEVDAAILGTTDKDTLLTCRIAWIVEAGEFDSLRDANMARLKNIVSRPVDTFRAPYGHDAMSVPRGWIAIGTTNADTYLRDSTGARRFWPVRCGDIDLEGLARDRDQLWAEALHLFRGGAKWYPRRKDEQARLAVQQEERRHIDPWEPVIAVYLAGKAAGNQPVTTGDILGTCLDRKPGEWTRADEMRVAEVLRALGWRKGTKSQVGGGARAYQYLPPGYQPVLNVDRQPGEDG